MAEPQSSIVFQLQALFPKDVLTEIFSYPIYLSTIRRLLLVNKTSRDQFQILRFVQRLIIDNDPQRGDNIRDRPIKLTIYHLDEFTQRFVLSFAKALPVWLWNIISANCINIKELNVSFRQIVSCKGRDITEAIRAILQRLNKLTLRCSHGDQLVGYYGDQFITIFQPPAAPPTIDSPPTPPDPTERVVIVDTPSYYANNLSEFEITGQMPNLDVAKNLIACFRNVRLLTLPGQIDISHDIFSNFGQWDRIDLHSMNAWQKKTSNNVFTSLVSNVLEESSKYSVRGSTSRTHTIFEFGRLAEDLLAATRSICANLVMNSLTRGKDIRVIIDLIRSGQHSHIMPSWDEIKARMEPDEMILGMARSDLSGKQLSEYIQALEPELSQKLSLLAARKDRRANILWRLQTVGFRVFDLLKQHGLIRLENVLDERDSEGFSLAHQIESKDWLVSIQDDVLYMDRLKLELGDDIFLRLHTTPQPQHIHIGTKVQLPLVRFWTLHQRRMSIKIMKQIHPDAYPQEHLSCSSDVETLRVALKYAKRCGPYAVPWMTSILKATNLLSIGSINIASLIWDMCLSKKDGRLLWKGDDDLLYLQSVLRTIKESGFIPDFFDSDDVLCKKALNALKTNPGAKFKLHKLAVLLSEFKECILDQFSQVDKRGFSAGRLLLETAEIQISLSFYKDKAGLQFMKTFVAVLKEMCKIMMFELKDTSVTQKEEEEEEECRRHDQSTWLQRFTCETSTFLDHFRTSTLKPNDCSIYFDLLRWLISEEFGAKEEQEDSERSALRRAHLLRSLRVLSKTYIAPLDTIFEICIPYLTRNEILIKDPDGYDLAQLVQKASSSKGLKIAEMLRKAVEDSSSA